MLMLYLLSEKTTCLGSNRFLSFIPKLLSVSQIARFSSAGEYEISILIAYQNNLFWRSDGNAVHHLLAKSGLDIPDKTEGHYSITSAETL